MNSRSVFASLFALLIAVPVFAQPNITGTSGTLAHNSSLTITGTGFGTKSTPGPTIYDDGNPGVSITALWTGAWPDLSPNSVYNMAYSTFDGTVAMPHSRITKYMTGAHGDCCGADQGNNVMFWKSFTPTYPQKLWVSWYERVHPSWTETDPAIPACNFGNPPGTGECANNKRIDYSIGTSPYDPDNWYSDFQRDINQAITTTGLNELCTNRDNDGAGFNCGGAVFPQETQGWNKIELRALITRDTTGFWVIQAMRGGTTSAITVLNLGTGFWIYDDTAWPVGVRNFGIGGYERKQSTPNNRRYFADIYFDLDWPHVVLGDASTYSACTIREAQIPTAWSSTSITITQKYGALSDGQTKYLYVMDSSGNVNANGFAITGGAGSPGPGGKSRRRIKIGFLVSPIIVIWLMRRKNANHSN